MTKRTVAMLIASALVAFAATASAEYGTWTLQSALPGPPGLSNSGFLGVAVGDLNDVYAVGLEQTGGSSMESGWMSSNQGVTWDGIYGVNANLNGCGAVNLFRFSLATASTGPQNVQYLNFGPDPQCIIDHPQFPDCMFICMFQMIPSIQYSNDGGNTFNDATIAPVAIFDNYTSMKYLDSTNGYMVGGPNLVARTQDGGQTWVQINSPGDAQTFFNDVSFLDTDTGFLVTGVAPASDDDTADREASDPQTAAMQRWQELRNRALWLKDPLYRAQHRADHPDGTRDTDGRIWRTTTGGQTWELVKTQAEDGFLTVNAIDPKHIWVMGSPNDLNLPFSLWFSRDSGDTWDNVSSRIPPMTINYPGWSMSALGFSKSGSTGFFVGLGGESSIILGSIVYYSTDRGETWTLDKVASKDLTHGFIALAFADEKHAFGVSMDLAANYYVQQHASPVAEAGPDQLVNPAAHVTLDGSGSYSPDGLALTYSWTQTAGDKMTLDDATAVKPTFTAGGQGAYTFQLTVTDTDQATGSDDVVITVATDDDDNDDNDASPSDDDESPAADDDDDASPAGPSSSSSSGNGCGC